MSEKIIFLIPDWYKEIFSQICESEGNDMSWDLRQYIFAKIKANVPDFKPQQMVLTKKK